MKRLSRIAAGIVLATAGACVSENDGLDDHRAGDVLEGARLSASGQWIRSDGTFEEPCRRVLAVAHAPDGRSLYVKDVGGFVVLDPTTLAVRKILPMQVDGCAARGLAVAPDGKRILVTGAKRVVREAVLGADGLPEWGRTFTWKSPSGGDPAPLDVAFAPDGAAAWVTWSKSRLLVRLDLATGEITRRLATGVCPTDVVLSHDGTIAFVADFGGRVPHAGAVTAESAGEQVLVDVRGVPHSATVTRLALTDGAADSEAMTFDTGLQPSALALAADGRTLLVAASGDDRIEAYDTSTGRRTGSLDLRPSEDLPYGVLPDALAVAPDGMSVAVACAGLNTVALVELEASGVPLRVRGHAATGWFPSGVSWRETALVVGAARGSGTQTRDKPDDGFRARNHRGGVTLFDASSFDWGAATTEALRRARLPAARAAMMAAGAPREGVAPRAVPERPGEPSTLKHVVYVIKENRTYDQVFGDLPQGDGRADFCIYGREVTPNHHAVAERWVLLDNAYCNGVVSADGHAWSTQGVVTPYVERGFGGWARSYDHGTDPLAYATSGFLWDAVLNRGLSFRNFGEYDFPTDVAPKGGWYPIHAAWRAGGAGFSHGSNVDIARLRRHSNPRYPGWNMAIPEQLRMDRFLEEFETWERRGEMPSLSIVYLPQDHTSGTSETSPSPRAHVADNDLAVGRLVEALSRSVFWKDTVVFSVEDDPQDGWDHIDGHRTVFLVASPWAKRGTVVKRFYNQNSVLHTICRILGVEPLTTQMASAPLMTECFTDVPDLAPYTALRSTIPIDEPNAPRVKALRAAKPDLVAAAESMNFRVPDRIDDDVMNRVLWHLAKGPEVDYPSDWAGAHGRGLAGRGVVFDRRASDDDDDDDEPEATPPRGADSMDSVQRGSSR